MDYKNIILTGKVYIKHINDKSKAEKGDLRIFVKPKNKNVLDLSLEEMGVSGYFKAEVFDGKYWQIINLDDFLESREYKISKSEKPIDRANLCCELLAQCQGARVFRTYRGHYSRRSDE